MLHILVRRSVNVNLIQLDQNDSTPIEKKICARPRGTLHHDPLPMDYTGNIEKVSSNCIIIYIQMAFQLGLLPFDVKPKNSRVL